MMATISKILNLYWLREKAHFLFICLTLNCYTHSPKFNHSPLLLVQSRPTGAGFSALLKCNAMVNGEWTAFIL